MSERLSRYVPADATSSSVSAQLRAIAASSVRTPWKAVLELRRMACLPIARAYFRTHGVAWGAGWYVYGLPVIQRTSGSLIRIGSDLEMRNWFASNALGLRQRCLLVTWTPDASIQIGDHVGISGATICAQTSITIGSHVLVGANAVIVDTDFHGLAPGTRHAAGAAAPIVIEDHAFIGAHSLILKGSQIGRGSVVGAGSVVSGRVPPGVIVAGNPARIVRELSAADTATPEALS